MGEQSSDIAFFRPSIGDDERAAVAEVLASGWLTTGARATEFEHRFAARVGASHAVALNSCTAAMHLALLASGVGPGDEVIVPTLTFVAGAEVVAHTGARPVLVDCRPDTLLMDPEAVAAAVTEGTRAVMPMHYGGQACDLGAIRDAVGPDVRVIDDAAHAFPTRDGTTWIGATADISCFSFYANKTITTGEGGMVTTEDEAIADRIRSLSLHGMSSDAWRRFDVGSPWDYRIDAAGFKYNLSDVAAAMGLVQIERADELAARRRAGVARYLDGLGGLDLVDPVDAGDLEDNACHLMVVRLAVDRLDCGRNEVIEQLAGAGVGTSVHYRPIHLQSYYQGALDFDAADLTVATAQFERIVSLPLFPDLPLAEVDRVIDVLADSLERHRR